MGDMNELRLAEFETILPQFATELRCFTDESIRKVSKLSVGGNNQLYKIEFGDYADPLLVKRYYADSIDRLDREFSALAFLRGNERLSDRVPRALWHNDALNYGVYSFEEGSNKRGVDLSEEDCHAVVDFAVDLQSFKPDSTRADFRAAVRASCSLGAYLNEADWRVSAFENASERSEVDEFVKLRTQELHAVERLDLFLTSVRKKLQAKDLDSPFHQSEARLNPMDFSLFSVLFRPNTKPCFVDFEYFGWDDPIHIIADFIQHDRTQGISPAQRSLILAEYRRRSDLPDATLDRLPVTIAILGAVWAARHLIFLTDEKLKPRQFAAGDQFDRQGYTEEQLGKLENRLDLLESSEFTL